MRARRAFLALYACSGAAGLIYEIVWTRVLSLHLGHTVAAVGTVLAAFMGGLAAGTVMGGRLAPRLTRERALRSYAAIECVIALCALALPVALRAFEPLLALAYGNEPGLGFALVRVASSFGLIVIPAAAIGATFPLAIRWYVGEASTAGHSAGGLYAINTAGAAVGALATGFVLIPAIGLLATTLVGVALNAAAAGGAWLIANQAPVPVPSPSKAKGATARPRESARRRAEAARPPTIRWLPGVVLGLAGFIAFVYEVAFTRVLAIALGPTTYAFAAMLTAFISGIAIGAALASRRSVIRRAGPFALGLLMLAVAAAGSAAGWFAGARLPLLVAEVVADPSAGASAILAREALYAVGVLLPLSATLGALFPIAVTLVAQSDDGVARDVSVVYAVNTLGAVAGSLAAAFVFIPWMGLQQTLRLGGAIAIGAACVAFLAGRLGFWQRGGGLASAVAAAAMLFTMPGWDLNLLSSGGYKYAAEVRDLGLDLETGLKVGSLLYYKEGAAATVSVRKLAGTVALAIDGKTDASNQTDMLTQKLLAHVPLLLHPNPRTVGIIGLGSGVTLGAALSQGIERADVIEISPEVVEASSFFAADNGGALEDPRTRLLVTDGRSHLRFTSRQYDVIISEPSNPWMAGVASLFTREFFLTARDRLAPGGIICQWAHTYDMADADLRSIAATFASVFPGGTLWLMGDGDVLLVASGDPGGPSLDNLSRGWQRPGVAADLADAHVFDPFSLLSLYVAGPAELKSYGEGAFIQTDDRPRLEFSGPIGVYERTRNDNASVLRALLDPARAPAAIRAAAGAAGAPEWRNLGLMLLEAQAYSTAYDSFARSVQLEANSDQALAGLIDAAGSGQRLVEARQLLESLAHAQPRAAAVRVALARLLAATGAFDQAVVRAREVIEIEPDSPRSTELLASIVADAGDVERLRPLVAQMQRTHPEREETTYYASLASFLDGNLTEAIARAERVVQMNPRHALAYNLIGSASASLGQRDRARKAFNASLEANPREASTYANLGRVELESGNAEAAATYFAESLTLDPTDESVRANLSMVLAAARR